MLGENAALDVEQWRKSIEALDEQLTSTTAVMAGEEWWKAVLSAQLQMPLY
tara:strand:- start:49 stop:201 length:153 start_codon:yes stop_codon:yes gene_type:complete